METGATVNVAVLEAVPTLAVMIALAAFVTMLVEMVNVAVDAEAGMVTVEGTVTEARLDDKLTTAPEGGAELKETVAETVPPPVTVAGDSVKLASAGTVTVTSCGKETPFEVAVMTVDFVPVAAGLAVILKVAEVEPAGTVTVAGTVAADVTDELSVTVSPPVGAALDRVTAPLAVPPGETTDGVTVQEASEAINVPCGRGSLHIPRP